MITAMTTTFKTNPKQHSTVLEQAKRKSRRENLSPDDIDLYPSNKVTRTKKYNKVFTGFGTFAVTPSVRYSLKCFGQTFSYQGIKTKIYNRVSLNKLFNIASYNTLYLWEQNGLLPPPLLVVEKKGIKCPYWLYHQIQPLYIWYMHMRLKYKKISSVNQKEINHLRKLMKNQEKRWYEKLGVTELNDADIYEKKAGKYGVILLDD